MPLNSFCAFIVLLISFLTSSVSGIDLLPNNEKTMTNFTELTGKNGYQSEEHRVVTEDGYILTVFRIVSARNCSGEKKKPPVVLMHGLLQSSDSFIDSGPSAGLAYLIADACHDLWLGNVRGNYYSRKHVRLNPDRDAAYWQFYVNEIGYYDVPAVIDYVLNNTKADKLNYIGFSQGAGTFFIMCSERPGYCDKVNIAICLAPASRQTHTSSIYFRTLTKSVADQEVALTKLGIYEILSKGGPSQELLAFLCPLGKIVTEQLCGTALDVFNSMESLHPGSITDETIDILFQHFPAGTSVHNLARYGQALRTDKFVKFDYGKQSNLEMYGSVSPPEYNLTAVTVPVLIVYGKNDGLVDPEDINWLVGKLPRVMEAFLVEDPLWNHLDVTYSQYTKKLIFPKINEYLDKYSYN